MRHVVLSYPMHRRMRDSIARKVSCGVNERTCVAIGFAGVSCILGTMPLHGTARTVETSDTTAITCSTSVFAYDLQKSALSPTLRFDKREIVKPVSTARPFR